MKATSKKARRAAKKLFPQQPNITRPFTSNDYTALPNIPNRPATK